MIKSVLFIGLFFLGLLLSIACSQPAKNANPNLTESDSVTNSILTTKQIKMGTQIWATGNLAVTHFSNGDTIPYAHTASAWEKAGEEGKPAWCYYNQDTVLGHTYGIIYNWYAVNDQRGLAPKGWHIPDDDEWEILTHLLGEEAGTQLKSASNWKEDGNGTNTKGFNALPGGYRYKNGVFKGVLGYGSFWSSTAKDSSGAWYRYLGATEKRMIRNFSDQGDGFYVRCIRN